MEKITANGKQIHLLGVAHVSRQSIRDVKDAIEKVKPDTIAVELDKKRAEILKKKKTWDNKQLSHIVTEGNTNLFLTQVLLGNFQAKLGKDLKVKPGAEMLAAVREAEKRDIPVVLADRPIDVTLRRAWAAMGIFEKFKLLGSLVSGVFSSETISKEEIEQLKKTDVITELMNEMAREMPKAKHVLVDERDAYLAKKIKTAQGKRILAVVGAGHVNGVKQWLKKKIPEEQPIRPSKIKYLLWLIPLIFIAILYQGFTKGGLDFTIDLFMKWFIINGALSAAGALLARGHWKSVLAAFVAAPFTSLNPGISAGIVAGAVELKVRMPKVKDVESLRKLKSFSDYTKNSVTRVMMVAAFSNIGSTIGTFLALPYLGSLL